jgi:predicted phosphodiesterase
VRYLVISDIHANWEALEAVLEDAKGRYDTILNCGDVVGYGPDPNRVTDWCREHTPMVIRGNHDKACSGMMDLRWFNPVATKAALWTQQELRPENLDWLRDLRKGPVTCKEFQAYHGSPVDEDEYIAETYEVEYASHYSQRPLVFFGHTHLQGAFEVHRNGTRKIKLSTIELHPDSKYFINPGSVGQPRDGNPRAAYAIYDTEIRTIEFKRAPYNIEATQAKLRALELPEVLAARLVLGR